MEMYCCVVWAVFEFTCTTHMPRSKSTNFVKWSASISCSLLFFVSADRRISWHLISTDLTDYPFAFNWHLDNVQVTHGLTGCVCVHHLCPIKRWKKKHKQTDAREKKRKNWSPFTLNWFCISIEIHKNREMYFCGAAQSNKATERNDTETIDVLYTWNWIVNIHINSQFTCRSSPSKASSDKQWFRWSLCADVVCCVCWLVLLTCPFPLQKRAIVNVETQYFFTFIIRIPLQVGCRESHSPSANVCNT